MTLHRHRQRVLVHLAALAWMRSKLPPTDEDIALRLAVSQILYAGSIIGAGKILRAFPALWGEWRSVLESAAKEIRK